MTRIYDAVIVGAGPAGAFCAKKLADLGLKVVVLEAHHAITRKVCGEYLCPAAVKLLTDEGLKEELIDPFPLIKGMKLYPFNERPITMHFPITHRSGVGISLNRAIFDQRLVDLASKSGAEINFSSIVTNIQRKEFGWSISDQEGHTINARLLIGADGRNSFVARSLNLRTSLKKQKIALHCHINAKKLNERFGEMHLLPNGSYIGIDPTGGYEVNFTLVTQANNLKKYQSLHQLMNHYISLSSNLKEAFGLISSDTKINSAYPISNKVKDIIGNNFALIGDAAGFNDPLTGEGMYQGLWMAQCLSHSIALKGNLFDLSYALKSYKHEKELFFRQKVITNNIFQFVIKRPWAVRFIAKFLRKSEKRANSFIGIIGNNYTPFEGIIKMIKPKALK